MGNVIDLNAHAAADERYRARLMETLQRIEAAEDALMNDLINLAMLGPWKKWNAEQPAGTGAQICVEDLLQTGDTNIAALAALMDRMFEVRRELGGHEI